jgi:hypothetical protein
MVTTLAVITATVFGVMVGVEFAVAVFVGPILRRLPVGAWIEASADGARVLGRVMPFWYIGSLLLVAWRAAAKWTCDARLSAGDRKFFSAATATPWSTPGPGASRPRGRLPPRRAARVRP